MPWNQHPPTPAAHSTLRFLHDAECVAENRERVFYVVAMRFRVYCTLFIYDCIVVAKMKRNVQRMKNEIKKKQTRHLSVESTESFSRIIMYCKMKSKRNMMQTHIIHRNWTKISARKNREREKTTKKMRRKIKHLATMFDGLTWHQGSSERGKKNTSSDADRKTLSANKNTRV